MDMMATRTAAGYVFSPDNVMATLAEICRVVWPELARRRGDWRLDMAWYLGKRECGMDLVSLGKAAGGVDYSTVSAAIKRLERRIAKNQCLCEHGRTLLIFEP
jgi:chromosomal replication initiation ATPase DnaA